MNNIMIAQEYRPKTLDQIVGHDNIVKEIKNLFSTKSYPQVSYFHGMTGTGKTTLAFNVAKLIQCEHKIDDVTPCNECSKCRDINKESFIEGTYMFNSSNIDLEVMRDIEQLTQTESWVSDKKVIILDEFQELNNNKKAQKNLLKVLEKPNSGIYFIILAMDDTKVDKSIKTRGAKFNLHPVDYMKISEYLYNICLDKKLELNEDQIDILMTISESSFGSVREACSKLGRVLAGNIWDKEELIKVLNLTDNKSVNEIIIKMIDSDPSLFNIEISEDIINQCLDNLIRFSKHLVGYQTQNWEKEKLKGLIGYRTASFDKVMNIISILTELKSSVYINKYVIDFHLLKLFKSTKTETVFTSTSTVNEEQPRRRRL